MAPLKIESPKGGKLRTVNFPKPSEELEPWMGKHFKIKRRITDTPSPYHTDGFIDRNGYFYAVDPSGHSIWAREIGCTENYLVAYCGWVAVWSYQSFTSKDPTPYFRFDFKVFQHLSKEQKRTMLDWCMARKVNIKRALGYYWNMFER